MLRPQLAYLRKSAAVQSSTPYQWLPIKATKDVTAYGASKWGVVALTKHAALESVEDGIPVNATDPDVINTVIFDSTPEDKMQAFESMQPGGRLEEPDEMVEIFGFLLSDEASCINAA